MVLRHTKILTPKYRKRDIYLGAKKVAKNGIFNNELHYPPP